MHPTQKNLGMKRFFLPFLGMLLFQTTSLSQVLDETVVAKSGDGIFSILRDEGIDPTKYYLEFVELNSENLINGSELRVGKEYQLPNAQDSFKNMGRFISLNSSDEKPLFAGEMAKMSIKSEKLKNAVYYLISENMSSDKKGEKFSQDITRDLAWRLLENGARVYVIASESQKEQTSKMENAQDYIDIINKRFLRNSGKYQRLLMVRANGEMDRKNLDISIYHHDSNDDGERLAANIQNVFKRYNTNKIVVQGSPDTFAGKENLFLAKNLLPALTLVEIGNQSTYEKQIKSLSVRPDKKALATWLGNGIFRDYAELEIED